MLHCGLSAMHAEFIWPPLNPVQNLDAPQFYVPPPPNAFQMNTPLVYMNGFT